MSRSVFGFSIDDVERALGLGGEFLTETMLLFYLIVNTNASRKKKIRLDPTEISMFTETDMTVLIQAFNNLEITKAIKIELDPKSDDHLYVTLSESFRKLFLNRPIKNSLH